MKKIKTIQIEREIVEETVCDACGKSINTKAGNAYDYTLWIHEGTYDPDGGGEGFEIEWDICEDCRNDFINHVNRFCKHNMRMLTKWEC